MKRSSTDEQTAPAFHITVAMIVVMLCSSGGCGEGSALHESDSDVTTSLTATDGLTAQPATVSDNDSETPQSAPPTDSEDATDQTASKEKSPPESTVAAKNPEDIEPTPKKPQGTRLPEDFLEGSELTPLNPQKTVFLDLPGKRILLRARVCLTEGLLEMLLCPHQTKEHESILSTEAAAFTVHTGLLALGCKEGKAARYNSETDEYTPASGQVIDIFLHWTDSDGKLNRKRAQNWVRRSRQRYYQEEFKTLPKDLKLIPDGNLRYDDVNQYLFWYGPMTDEELTECLKMSSDEKFQTAMRRFHKEGQEKPMEAEWVFVGSGFYEDGDAAKQYLAEGGYMICVANFPMAMIDVSTPSDSNGTESLTYEAATERLPPRDSEVMIELVPRTEGKTGEKNDSATPSSKPKTKSAIDQGN